MEQDILIEYSSRFLHFYRNNKAAVWASGIGIVLIIGLVIGYFFYSSQQETEAQILLGTAEEYYMNGEYERALHGDDEAFTPGFIQIADNYGSTRSGNLAHYYAAMVFYELEEYEDALAHLTQFEIPSGIMGVGPLSFHAILLSELNQNEAAGDKFVEAALWNENESTTPYNLLEAAMAYEAAGEVEKAIEQLDRIISDYPDSPGYTEAQRLRGTLTTRS